MLASLEGAFFVGQRLIIYAGCTLAEGIYIHVHRLQKQLTVKFRINVDLRRNYLDRTQTFLVSSSSIWVFET